MRSFSFILALAILSSVFLSSCQSSGCVGEGTLIDTPSGVKLVEELQVGDIVLSPDPLTNYMFTGRVSSIRTAARECLVFSLEDGGILRVTPEHPLWDPAELRFKTAGEFVTFEKLSFSGAGFQNIHSTRIVTIAEESVRSRVFDLTIDSKSHTFIANGVLVHNKLLPPEPPPAPVNDLVVEVVDDTTALAIWTEPGPQNNILLSAEFYIDTSAVTDTTLDLARVIMVDLMEATGGAVDSAILSGLEPSTTYNVRMKVSRGFEYSKLSNTAIVTTGP